MDGIGVELGFQSHTGILAVMNAALAGFVQEIAGVELNARTVGADRHAPAGYRVGQLGAGIAEDLKIVVVAPLKLQRLVIRVELLADGLGTAEVHGGALYAPLFPGGDGLGIVGVKEPGGHGQQLLHGGVGVSLPPEVKIAVVCQVEHGVLVALGIVDDMHSTGGVQTVGHPDVRVSGEALVTMGAVQAEGDGSVGGGNQGPHPFEVHIRAGVEAVAVFVGGQMDSLLAQGEGGSRDPVGAPAYGSTQAGAARGIARAIVIAQHHIGKGSLLVGYQKAHKGCAVVGDLGGDPATGYGVEGGFLAGWQNAEIFSHGNDSFHFSWGNGRGYVKALFVIILYSLADFKPFFHKRAKSHRFSGFLGVEKPGGKSELFSAEKEDTVFCVQKGNSNCAQLLNNGLKKVKENGTYDELYAKYFSGEENDNVQITETQDKNVGIFGTLKFIFVDENRWQYYVNGLGTTLLVSLLSVFVGLLLGLIVAIIRINADRKGKKTIASLIAAFYVDVIRGTPSVLQLMIVYFAVFHSRLGYVAAVVSFGINSGAYVSEVIRGGIQAVDRGQTEAGRSLGLCYKDTMRYIVIPQAVKNILPAMGNEFIQLIKETSILGYVGIVDLTKAASYVSSRTYKMFIPLLAAGIVYYLIVKLLSVFLRKFERRLKESD